MVSTTEIREVRSWSHMAIQYFVPPPCSFSLILEWYRNDPWIFELFVSYESKLRNSRAWPSFSQRPSSVWKFQKQGYPGKRAFTANQNDQKELNHWHLQSCRRWWCWWRSWLALFLVELLPSLRKLWSACQFQSDAWVQPLNGRIQGQRITCVADGHGDPSGWLLLDWHRWRAGLVFMRILSGKAVFPYKSE